MLSFIAGMVDGLCMPEHVQTQFCNADYGKDSTLLYFVVQL
jgi:hypothetical protein